MIEYLETHEVLIFWLSAVSFVTFAGTLIIVPWLIVHMPADYFAHQSRHKPRLAKKYFILKIIILMAKNMLGLILVAAGIIMLFIPGQGLLTIGIGIVLLDLPGKYTFERWFVGRGPVLRAINRTRLRAGRPPIDL